MTALYYAWCIAGAHNHHWAWVPRTDERVRIARRIKNEIGFQPQFHVHSSLLEGLGENFKIDREEYENPEPPRNHEEADILGYWPAGTCQGRMAPPLFGESISDGTDTRRANWVCYPDFVEAWIERPLPGRSVRSRLGVVTLYTIWQPGITSVDVDVHGPYNCSHIEALAQILRHLPGGEPELCFPETELFEAPEEAPEEAQGGSK